MGVVLTTLQTHLTGTGGPSSASNINNNINSSSERQESSSSSASASMGVVCVQALALLLSEDRLAEHVVPHLATVAALLVKVIQSSTACHYDCFLLLTTFT